MNALRKLIGGGGKKKGKGEFDYEAEHVETDFDKAFEEARRESSVIPQIKQECDYRGSPSRSNRSKSPTPYQQQNQNSQQQQNQQKMVKKSPSAIGEARSPICARKGSAPGACKTAGGGKAETEANRAMQMPDKDQMKRKLTESQQKRARDIVESMDWIKPAEVCFSASAQPQIAKAEAIHPQVHECEMMAMPRANPQWAVAIIPQKQLALPPLSASGRCVSGGPR